jgi:hypothetical protein
MSLTISLNPDDLEKRMARLGIACRYTPEERKSFSTTPIIDRPERIFGFPVPADNAGLTLENIKSCVGTDPRRQPCFFEHPWYAGEDFMRVRCKPGWHFLQMDVLQESVQQPVDYLDRLKGCVLGLPEAVEVVLMLFLHYVGAGEQLLLRKHTWCSDRASFNRHVTVGAFGRNGVFLSGHPAGFASRGLGVCARVSL